MTTLLIQGVLDGVFFSWVVTHAENGRGGDGICLRLPSVKAVTWSFIRCENIPIFQAFSGLQVHGPFQSSNYILDCSKAWPSNRT